jgi:DNA (cytosine-5)-methyltransferase 1
MKSITAIDIFSGCGGLTQGLLDAGIAVCVAVEIDCLASETYSANHPSVHLITADIRSTPSNDLLAAAGTKRGELDLLAGCPPCQGFSRLRNKNRRSRIYDPKNVLIDEMGRLIEEIYPKVVLLENVPALRQYTRFTHFRRRLKTLGYYISEEIIDIAEFGLPQRRKRLVLLSSRLGPIIPAVPNHRRATVRDAIGHLPVELAGIDPAHCVTEKRTERIRQLIRSVPKDGGSRADLPVELQLRCHAREPGFFDVYGRMRWDDVSPTITSGCVNPSRGRFLHPAEDRAITLREAALLQGFPKDYFFSLRKGKYAAAEMIGNALPPLFSAIQAAAIASHIRSYDL